MPDIATENPYVQQKVCNYVQELKSVGVDGLRWDAAKHIGVPSEGDDFWKSVTQYGLYNYGEILGGPDDRSTGNEDIMKEYTDYISVTDSNWIFGLQCPAYQSSRVLPANGFSSQYLRRRYANTRMALNRCLCCCDRLSNG